MLVRPDGDTREVGMRALVVYESMFGNTHAVADEVAHGLRWRHECDVVTVAGATDQLIAAADLLVVGGPTHVHGLPGDTSRRSAMEMAADDPDLHLEPDVGDDGLREWLDGLTKVTRGRAAAFDTRASGPAAFTGRASKAIGKRLRRHGYLMVAEPESFLVDRYDGLLDGEVARAEAWGQELGAALVAVTAG